MKSIFFVIVLVTMGAMLMPEKKVGHADVGQQIAAAQYAANQSTIEFCHANNLRCYYDANHNVQIGG
jgi:hypothetical protein